jgi:alkylation response protein AidB-like acyl-CoA dehydrogenase
VELLAAGCANTALQVSIQGMVCEGIRRFGNRDQKKLFLVEKGVATGNHLAAFALTEPCCGSDAKAIRTRARLAGDHYVLDGIKTLITSPGEADLVLVYARAEAGISAFLVPRDTPGFHVARVIPKLGCRGHRLSEIRLENCAIPAGNLLGEEGLGLEYGKQMLTCGRITIAALGVGIAQAAYERALSYSRSRQAFGACISSYQLTQEKLADMATGIRAARLMTLQAAWLKERGEKCVGEAAQAKLLASETALRVCDAAIQIHGGYGYTDEWDVHRHWRDARMLTLGEGTSEMLRLLIARQELKRAGEGT